MGRKSDKKIKSERVNALRKQYDAFLEEDKKRKERNEYILGKLDNMRCTTVQTRHKALVCGDFLPANNRFAYQTDLFERRDNHISHRTQNINRIDQKNLQLDIPTPYSNKNSLLKEISKSYILIPKLRPALLNDYCGGEPSQSLPPVTVSAPKTQITNNEDWKSKYDILKQLKTNVKEDLNNKYVDDELFPVKDNEIPANDNDQNIERHAMQKHNTKYNTKYEQEVPEKDLRLDNVNLKIEPQQQETSEIHEGENHSVEFVPADSHSFNLPDSYSVCDNTPQTQELSQETVQNYNYSEEHSVNPEYYNEEHMQPTNINEQQINFKSNLQPENLPEYEQVVTNESDIRNDNIDPDQYSPIQTVSSTESEEKVKEDDQIQVAEEYPIDVEEFTPGVAVQLEDGVNVNPVYLTGEENVAYQPANEENNIESYTTDQPAVEEEPIQQIDHSGIEEFDTEQKNMFYSEDTNAYAYEQQPAAGDVFTGDQTQEVYQTQDPLEQHQQPEAQDYAYYEGTTELREQEYPTEINEHEETNSQYDQNYEQQYTTDYQQAYDPSNAQQEGYVQGQEGQQAYDHVQDEQQYNQVTDVYDQNQQQYQDYQYQQVDPDTAQHVEQVLDNEEGYYVETPNLQAGQDENVVENQAVEQTAS